MLECDTLTTVTLTERAKAEGDAQKIYSYRDTFANSCCPENLFVTPA
jgi:hypothetical protein